MRCINHTVGVHLGSLVCSVFVLFLVEEETETITIVFCAPPNWPAGEISCRNCVTRDVCCKDELLFGITCHGPILTTCIRSTFMFPCRAEHFNAVKWPDRCSPCDC